jgi:hypothetical protein
MSKRAKQFAAIRNNPNDVAFDDACKVAEWLGFVHKGGSGSHRAYGRTGEPAQLNFQSRNGRILAYQARQLIEMIDKYGDDI